MTIPAGPGAEVRIFPDRDVMDRAAADLIAEHSRSAIAARGQFTLALSGGTTPRGLYGLLASSACRNRIDWKATHVFWADERCVAPDHVDSNYRLVFDLLLSQVPVPKKNVHRIRGEDDPAVAAAAYERELISFFGSGRLFFDLIILGMGVDGHTASLFPGSAALAGTGRLVLPVTGPGSVHERVTLTLPAINSARATLFLVAGAEKAGAVREVMGERNGERFPAGLVRPATGRTLWFLDRDAGQLLRATS